MKNPKKSLTKIMSMILASTLFLAACTGNDKPAGSNDPSENQSGEAPTLKENTLPITTENITLTLYMGISGGARQIYKDMSEMDLIKAMEEETGINLEFVHPPEQDSATFFTSMISSGTYPDVIQNDFTSYPGGAIGAMDDGIILDATDLIDEYAYWFNYQLDEKNPSVRKNSMSDDGRYLRFGTVFLCPLLEEIAHGGFIVRQDILTKHNMDLPETIEEYEAMFDLFLEEGLVPWSLSLKDWQFTSYSPVATAFGLTVNNFQIDGDEVSYSRTRPEYKDFLEVMARWYEKGYITSNSLTQTTSDAQKEFQAGQSGAVLAGSWEVITLESVGQAAVADLSVVGLPLPRLEKGQDIHTYNAILHSPEGRRSFISAQTKHPVEAVRFVDYLFRPETIRMTAWGVNTDEQTLWTEENGKRQWTDFMLDNPDFDYEIGRQRYTANVLQGMWDEEMESIQYGIPQVQQAWGVWRPNTDDAQIIPNFTTMTTEESREYNVIMETVTTYADEEMFKFISGQNSLDKFDEFVSTIESMDIERAEELWKAAYERYLNR